MANETSGRPRLTPKGERTRARIVEEAAILIHERGVAGTTLDDVKAAAEVSGSQLYHYFPDKNDLVQAVIDYQADAAVTNQRHADLGSVEGVQAWRHMVITAAERVQAKGGCPLGSLGGQLAESDPEARSLMAAGFERWTTEISAGLRSLQAGGQLNAAHRAIALIFLPTRTRDVAAHHALDGDHVGTYHQHGAPAQLVGVLLELRRIFVDIGGREVVRDDVLEKIEPEKRQLGQHAALFRDAGGEYVVERRNAIGGDEQQLIGINPVHITNFAAGEKLKVGNVSLDKYV